MIHKVMDFTRSLLMPHGKRRSNLLEPACYGEHNQNQQQQLLITRM
jgi:hypothetical protein